MRHKFNLIVYKGMQVLRLFSQCFFMNAKIEKGPKMVILKTIGLLLHISQNYK